jgi:hypothetical protein
LFGVAGVKISDFSFEFRVSISARAGTVLSVKARGLKMKLANYGRFLDLLMRNAIAARFQSV